MAKTTRKRKSEPNNGTAVANNAVLSVLGYREEGEWVALALEMDIRGCGATLDDALTELRDLVAMQIGFARFKGQPEMISKPAEPVYWRLFEIAMQDYLRDLTLSSIPTNPEYEARSLSLPPAHVIAALSNFSEARS